MTCSQRKTVSAVMVVGMLTMALGVASAQAPIPGLGTWKLNVANRSTVRAPLQRA